MTKDFRNILIKYSLALLIGLLIEWWVVFYSPLNLPESIPMIPIKTSGLLLMIVFLTIFIKAEKEYLRINQKASILELTSLGTVICLSAEIVFQLIRQPFLNAITFSEHLYYYTISVFVVTIFCTFFSFLIAFQLKTRKTVQLILFIIGFVVVFNVIGQFFPQLFGPY